MSGRLGQAVRLLFQVDDSPHRVALAFGIGVFIAFSPLLGFHTAIALALAFAFRLNRVAILIGAYVNNPWTLAPLYLAGTAFGCLLLGIPIASLEHDVPEAGASTEAFLASLKPYVWPFVVGNLVLGTVAALVGYAAVRRWLERRRQPAPAVAGPGA